MPLKDEEKIRAFSEKVIGDANELAAQIATEAYEKKEAAFKAGQAEIESAIRMKYEAEYRKSVTENSFTLSKATLTKSKEYLALRDEITEKVLARTEELVTEFSGGNEYPSYLQKLCRKVGALMAEPFSVSLRPEDMHLVDTAKEAAGPLCSEVTEDESIRLGGAKFRSCSGGMVINETLEENLAHCIDELMLLMGKYLRVDD